MAGRTGWPAPAALRSLPAALEDVALACRLVSGDVRGGTAAAREAIKHPRHCNKPLCANAVGTVVANTTASVLTRTISLFNIIVALCLSVLNNSEQLFSPCC